MAEVDALTEFSNYEEYLDSQVTGDDLFYLEDETIARQLVELGYRTTGKVLTKEEFDARKEAVEAKRLAKLNRKIFCASEGIVIEEPLMCELSKREMENRHGNMNTIVFVRDHNASKQEISGYIDFAHRLTIEDWAPYFNGTKKLLPKQSDLSYFNWATQNTSYIPSQNFDVILDDSTSSLFFLSKKDLKHIDPDPKAESPGEDSIRYELESPNYIQISIIDHKVRRKL